MCYNIKENNTFINIKAADSVAVPILSCMEDFGGIMKNETTSGFSG